MKEIEGRIRRLSDQLKREAMTSKQERGACPLAQPKARS